jgi:hypothetical protein
MDNLNWYHDGGADDDDLPVFDQHVRQKLTIFIGVVVAVMVTDSVW